MRLCVTPFEYREYALGFCKIIFGAQVYGPCLTLSCIINTITHSQEALCSKGII